MSTLPVTNELEIWVAGIAAPQGSKRHVGGGRMVEMSKKLKPWRAGVEQAARDAATMDPYFQAYDGPVQVNVTFYLPRPRRHYGTGRNADILKVLAPVWVQAKPDLDKLLRSTFDALTTARIWTDDSLAARVTADKKYAAQAHLAGAFIHLRPLALTA